MMSDTATSLLDRSDRARREHRVEDAHRDRAAALELCRQSEDRELVIRALKALGEVESDLGHGDRAQALYEEAVELCRAAGDPLLLAHTVRHLGDVHRRAGRVNLAERCYDEALALYRGHGEANALDLANAIRPMAILKMETGEAGEAIRLWTEARELYAAAGIQAGVDEASGRLAILQPS
jgi:tetratricopeptide (TPR) repeat protein